MIYTQKIRNHMENTRLLELLRSSELTMPQETDDNLGLYDGDELIGCGFLKGNILQGLVIDKKRQGDGLSATLVTGLIKLAAGRGINYIRVFTKPAMASLLTGLGMRVVADASPYAVFLEYGHGSAGAVSAHLLDLARDKPEDCAGIVMNCNPFTKGHRALIERAAAENPWVWVIAVEEDKSVFPYEARLRLMREGTEDLRNAQVIPGGEYVISSLTFPAYFTRDADLAAAQGAMDAAIFARVIAPALKITRRYVGTEPYSESTGLYNLALRRFLPPGGIEVIEVPRVSASGTIISASKTREYIKQENWDAVKEMVPDCTWRYLRSPEGRKVTNLIKETQ